MLLKLQVLKIILSHENVILSKLKQNAIITFIMQSNETLILDGNIKMKHLIYYMYIFKHYIYFS